MLRAAAGGQDRDAESRNGELWKQARSDEAIARRDEPNNPRFEEVWNFYVVGSFSTGSRGVRALSRGDLHSEHYGCCTCTGG
jgi:hypothetical protein